MTTAIALFSGGLDSILAVKLIEQQNITVKAIAFITPFFGPETAQRYIRYTNADLHIADITEHYFEMLKNPPHGYGKNMNPCIDCHALMFRCAGERMKAFGADFIFSGEVLGERPMSQNRNSLETVAKGSGFKDRILRPLSALLLPPTQAESDGRVDRSRLLNIQGRSRKPQIALAEKLGISDYPEPAGGCKLTDPAFSKRLKHLLANKKNVCRNDLELLSAGRHFFTEDRTRIIVGRDEKDNRRITALCGTEDILMTLADIPGPTVIIPGGTDHKNLALAAAICFSYSNAVSKDKAAVIVSKGNREVQRIMTGGIPRNQIRRLMV